MAPGAIYLATDFSPASERAFDAALDVAKLRGAELVIGHVVPTPGVPECGVAEVAKAFDLRIREEIRLETLRRAAEQAGVPARIEILGGSPSDALAAAAGRAHAAILVLGKHGRTGFSRLPTGSVTAHLLCSAPCPVMTIRDIASA